MLHSVILLNDDGYVLLARYFNASTLSGQRDAFEATLAALLPIETRGASASRPHPLSPQASSPPCGQDTSERLLCCHDQFVLLRRLGELRVLVAGNGVYDELILGEFLDVVLAVLTTQLEKKPTEAALMTHYAHVVVALDELVQHGHWEAVDDASVDQLTRLRPYPVK